MIQSLTPQQIAWVDQTLSTLSMEACVAQLLNVSQPMDTATWLEFLKKVPVGALSARVPSAQAYRSLLAKLNAASPVPLLVIANMEHGAAEIPGYGTDFPSLMAAGAANDPDLVALLGKATASEARHIGVNWVLTPDIDLNYNFDNPVTNTRAIGDRPELVATLGTALIQALQANGVAATAKHFPGDGMDSRDQHLVTTVNNLPFEQWMATFGHVWQSAINAGVWTIMPGHISLPAYQGFFANPEDAPPATIARELLETLLRQELGFAGLIVSDATGMIGFASRLAPAERAVAAINAGIDLYLGANPEVDYPALLAAVQEGRLSEERVQAAARRVLELKARLHLAEAFFGPAPTAAESAAFADAAQTMAEKSITLVRNGGRHPLQLAAGAKVLTVTIMPTNTMIPHPDLTVFDEELQARGYQVEHLLNPRSDELRTKAQEHDVVFINVNVGPMMTLGSIRVAIGSFGHWGWRALFTEHPQVVYTSFGTPYLTFELPHAPTLALAYGGNPMAQRAAVKFWLGEIPAQGTLPVRLPQVTIQPLAR
ncbi:MAG: glycoside hydrolase family 3 N-terminal domain-containing protein [Caldilineaceae bacterium]